MEEFVKNTGLFLRLCALVTFVGCILAVSAANSSEITAFGPKKYVRTTGAPNIYQDTFAAEPGEAWLIIRNGLEGQKSNEDNRVTSGVVSLNGDVLFTHNDFKHQTYILETPVSLIAGNALRVELESKPGSYLSIEIIQTIADPIKDLLAAGVEGNTTNCPEYIDSHHPYNKPGRCRNPGWCVCRILQRQSGGRRTAHRQERQPGASVAEKRARQSPIAGTIPQAERFPFLQELTMTAPVQVCMTKSMNSTTWSRPTLSAARTCRQAKVPLPARSSTL